MEYGQILLNFRATHNLTQAELAKILGVQTNMICRYECGKCTPTKKNQIRFALSMEQFDKSRKIVGE